MKRAAALLMGSVMLLAGCAAVDRVSGSASMHIDVEVYKGPLAKDPSTQWGELVGLVQEAQAILAGWARTIRTTDECKEQEQRVRRSFETLNADAAAAVKAKDKAVTEAAKAQERVTKARTEAADAVNAAQSAKGVGAVIVARIRVAQAEARLLDAENALKAATDDKDAKEAIATRLAGEVTAAGAESRKSEREKAEKECGNLTVDSELKLIHDHLKSLIALDDPLASFARLARDAKDIEVEKDLREKRNLIRKFLRDVASVATRMQAKSFLLAGDQLSEPRYDREARVWMNAVAFLLSETANQMATRADALLQQMAGPDRSELPLSVHLRNTHPTDFINLYVWNRATGFALVEDILARPVRSLSSTETTDRVRVYERLFADYNWSNVNSVYASGQGDVSMAFVKDDIGNWNLKTFDNDPTELLKAYVDVGKAVLKEAAAAVAGAGSGGATVAVSQGVGKAQQLMEFANRVNYGRTSQAAPTLGGLDVVALRTRAADKIEALRARAKATRTTLTAELTANEKQIGTLKSQHQDAPESEKPGLTKQIESLTARNGVIQKQLDSQAADVAKETQQILAQHAEIVELLQRGIATPPRTNAR